MIRRWWHRLAGHPGVVDLAAHLKAGALLACPGCGSWWAPGHDRERQR